MRKLVVLFLFVTVTGCSGLRRAGKSDEGKGLRERDAVSLSDIMSQNLSSRGFYIQKADIEIDSENAGMSFVATVRFVVPDEYLISLRMRVGLEVARIYMNSDTVLVNDRINRILYYGDPAFLSSRYGIPFEIIPVIFGDLVTGTPEVNGNLKCIEGKVSVDAYVKGMKLIYEIDCSSKKSVVLKQEGSYNGMNSDITYSGFRKNNDITAPEEITIHHKESGSKLKIRIGRIETPWEGSIDFIPGNRYEQVELR